MARARLVWSLMGNCIMMVLIVLDPSSLGHIRLGRTCGLSTWDS